MVNTGQPVHGTWRGSAACAVARAPGRENYRLTHIRRQKNMIQDMKKNKCWEGSSQEKLLKECGCINKLGLLIWRILYRDLSYNKQFPRRKVG